MILTVPFQALEIGNIHLNPFQTDKYGKTLARLSYKDNSIDFQDVPILSPPVKIIDYNQDISRLRVDLSDQFQFKVKLNTLQEYLISTFYVHQQSFLLQSKPYEVIRELFNFLLDDDILSIYVFPTTTVKRYDGVTCKLSDLKPGSTIRFVIRFQGISQFNTKKNSSLRMQHTVPSIILISEK
jgi:hypothetical protein